MEHPMRLFNLYRWSEPLEQEFLLYGNVPEDRVKELDSEVVHRIAEVHPDDIIPGYQDLVRRMAKALQLAKDYMGDTGHCGDDFFDWVEVDKALAEARAAISHTPTDS
jgi:hypothetical protein